MKERETWFTKVQSFYDVHYKVIGVISICVALLIIASTYLLSFKLLLIFVIIPWCLVGIFGIGYILMLIGKQSDEKRKHAFKIVKIEERK